MDTEDLNTSLVAWSFDHVGSFLRQSPSLRGRSTHVYCMLGPWPAKILGSASKDTIFLRLSSAQPNPPADHRRSTLSSRLYSQAQDMSSLVGLNWWRVSDIIVARPWDVFTGTSDTVTTCNAEDSVVHDPFDSQSNEEPRLLVSLLTKKEGKSLEEAESSIELLTGISHAMLGWLNLFQHGYLHRDISIDSILLLKKPEDRNEFKVSKVLRTAQHLDHAYPRTSAGAGYPPTSDAASDILSCSHIAEMTARMKGLSILPSYLEAKDTRLEILLKELDFSRTCAGFVTDGDMSMKWHDLFENWPNDEAKKDQTGTRDFMSDTLIRCAQKSFPYVQSPVDDLWSFFYVTIWAVLFNKHNAPNTYLRDRTSSTCGEREGLVSTLTNPSTPGSYVLEGEPLNPVTTQVLPVLRSWHQHLRALQVKANNWALDFGVDEVRAVEWGWHIIAVIGVCDFLEILRDHREVLWKHPSFIVAESK